MKSEFKFALLALAEAVACVGLVGCGGSGGDDIATDATAQAQQADGSVQVASAEDGPTSSIMAAVTPTWERITGENSSFTVTGTKTVRYGRNDSWVTKNVTGTGQCTNAFFGSDPVPGNGKFCEVSSVSPTTTPTVAAPAPAPAPAAAGTWTTVAKEWTSFTLKSATVVRFGLDNKWISATLQAGTQYCGITTFGKDPYVGPLKQCQIQTSAAPAPAPAPAPTPAPAPAPAVTGSAVLAWVAPTKNSDGSNLSDLAGYKIYYGTTRGTYSQSITISSPYTTNYTISNLPAGTYYMIVKAYDTSNNESAASVEATKTIK
jgi:hypothetical protein